MKTETAKEANQTMMEKGYEIKGIHLDKRMMAEVHQYYIVAQTQEYLVETYYISLDNAKKIAQKARQLQEDSCMPVWDTGCVEDAAKQLHISLVKKENI